MKKLIQEMIKKEISDFLLEQKLTDVSKFYNGRKIWYNHLKPLTDPRNKLYKWDEKFRKVGININGIFSVGDEISGKRNLLWFKCDKKTVDPVQFIKKLTSTNDTFYENGSWRIVEDDGISFVLEFDVDI